jgi:hypothetical protein
MKLAILLALLLATCTPAHAELALLAGGWSTHLSSGDYNETHKATIVEYKN